MSRQTSLSLLFFGLLLTVAGSSGWAQVSAPSSFLGYDLGERFTRHHDITAYFEHVAEQSEFVELQRYGTSYENRPMLAVFISSRDNILALDTIRVNNRRTAGLDGGPVNGRTAAIVWMSYGIHGNESSSPEAAMMTLYELVSGLESPSGADGHDIPAWLEETVVVMDPVLNPDGRERYVNWFDQMAGRRPDPRTEVREHHESWPGGRSNHYYFDLNRDWAWQTQIESRQRIAFYNLWMPHVHADFHEMFRNDYYFPPAAEPFHKAITPWQREFQEKIGENHARYFDERFEGYFTGEIFDLFYPGYGDTWPTFNGAIGMTYEQMGHGRAGTSMIRDNGDTLTLADRIQNHHMAGMSTVEVTALNSERLRSEFHNYFRMAEEEPEAEFASVVIGGENHPDRLLALLDYLDRQEIRYRNAEAGQNMSGRHYLSGEEQLRQTEAEDIVVPLSQPKSALARVLFDPDPELADSNTYDITAWALPYAYGLDAWAVEDRVPVNDEPVRTATRYEPLPEEAAYAYAIPWGDVRDAAMLADLLKAGVRVQFAEASFTIAGNSFAPGTLLVLKNANRSMGKQLRDKVDHLAAKHDRPVTALPSGRTDHGPDLSSPRTHLIEKPVAAVPAGPGIHSYNLGELWHYFDYTLDYPLGMFQPDRLPDFPLEDYNVLILPQGNYRFWEDSDWEKVMNWVEEGGRLIAFSSALTPLAGMDETGIVLRDFEEDNGEAEPGDIRFGDRRREALSRRISGSVLRTTLDETHPLAYGLGDRYATLTRGTLTPELLENGGWNVGWIPEDEILLGGWAGEEAISQKQGSLMAGTRTIGDGQIVILADNPLFRGFWRNGALLFSNALFHAGIAR